MVFPSLQNSLEKIPNRYLLVVLSARRARQLNRGAPSLVESKRKKCASVALEEVAAGKITYASKEETPAGKGSES